MTTEWFNFWNGNSSKDISTLESFFSPELYETSRSVLNQLNARKLSVLIDFGCGTGNLLSQTEKGVKKSIGVDFSKRASNHNKSNAEIVIADCFDTKIKSEIADRTYCFSLLNYLTFEEAIATIQEMDRVTKKKGFILLGDIINSKFEKVFELKTKNLSCPKLTSYRPDELMRVLNKMFDDSSYEIYLFDTNIKEYKNSGMTFNILIQKR